MGYSANYSGYFNNTIPLDNNASLGAWDVLHSLHTLRQGYPVNNNFKCPSPVLDTKSVIYSVKKSGQDTVSCTLNKSKF